MKTSKAKPVHPAKKTSATSKTPRKKKVTPARVPTEDEIREKAREIYFERIARGEHGTPEGDWREAEELLMGS